MSDGEGATLMLAMFAAAWLWGRWYFDVFTLGGMLRNSVSRRTLAIAPLVAFLLVFAVLKFWASADVRDSPTYLLFYLVLGGAWTGFAARLPIRWLGLSARDDALERANAPAAIAIGGAIVGVALCYAGGNIGDGPGWWVVLFCMLLSTAAFAVLWLVLEKLGRLSETITVHRDPAAGVRAAGFFIGLGAILGRSVAGNWISAGATVRDFAVHGWPALALTFVAVVVERVCRPTPARPFLPVATYGVAPSLFFVAAGAAAVLERGGW